AFAQTSQAFAFAGGRISRPRAAMMPEQEKTALDRLNGPEKPERIMSDEFYGVGATAKAGIGTPPNKGCAPASQIANELRNKRPEHFVDKLSLADVHASLGRAPQHGEGLAGPGSSAAPISEGDCGLLKSRSGEPKIQLKLCCP